jgi:hypothetical protein
LSGTVKAKVARDSPDIGRGFANPLDHSIAAGLNKKEQEEIQKNIHTTIFAFFPILAFHANLTIGIVR